MSDFTPTSSTTCEPTRPNGAAKIDKYFRAMSKHEASDLHMKAGTPPKFRLNGTIRNIDGTVLSNEQIESMIFEIMGEENISDYRDRGSVDFAYQLSGADRYRINVFRQRGQTSIAARRVPREILSFKQLNLPESLANLAGLHQGLVLVTGITGSGKSTTIAAMLEEINRTRACHIMTLEDPIEFLYQDKMAFVNQREIGRDVENYHDALKYMMREDPDVVLIGELRDQETYGAALAAAETGHLVFGTIHSSSAGGTVARILELFPEEQRALIRSSLVFNLQAIVCLKLLPGLRPEIPRVPACEIMICNGMVRKMIADGRDNELSAVIRSSPNEGMVDFTESIRSLVNKEWISVKTAYAAAPNPDELRMRLKGISVGGGGIVG
ncbi:MAG: PilT/PilU family type 4a pilus ATPase [Planctomycetes bacterium]|nr:PilT/PilU family type 4a pilus ATPase [Planctomycetota bacterium]